MSNEIYRRIIVCTIVISLSLPMFTFNSAPLPFYPQSRSEELTLRVAIQEDITSLNPLATNDKWSWKALEYIYDVPTTVNR
ncbi:MAG: hypothetical protein KAX31_05600, partial [Thermoplasmata archaeon]|nr:hypothetical protein [Thermoplasmata archaeon]